MPTPQTFLFKPRVLGWFSCGAASAVAMSLGLKKYGSDFLPIYCDTAKSEDEDNERFIVDVQQWLGVSILRIKSDKYTTVEDVFADTKYMAGPDGARCTTELKKLPRLSFQNPEDVHVFGFTADETAPYTAPKDDRIAKFEKNNPELFLDWILRDNGVTKQACYQVLISAGVKLPEMYLRGYPHNNCPGCVKSSSAGYWNKIRRDYPKVFASRATQSREIGCRLVKYKKQRIFLDELPPNARGRWKDEKISCGPDCGNTSTN